MKKQFLFAAFAFAALSFASCTNDADLNGGKAPGLTEEKEEVGYMSFSLRSETRTEVESNGEKFDEGTVQEYALAGTLNSHVAIFFDADDGYFGYSYLTPKSALQTGDHKGDADHKDEGQYSTSEKLYTYITRDPRVSKNGEKPASVLLLLNVKPAHLAALIGSLSQASTVEDVKKALGSKDMYGIYKVNDEQYYTMTNSAYVENNELKLAADCSTKVSTSPEAAAANPVTVFVERVVAKHSLVFNTTSGSTSTLSALSDFITPAENTDELNTQVSYVEEFYNEANKPQPETKTWKVNVVRWGANALERNTFLYKRLQNNTTNKALFTYNDQHAECFGAWWSRDFYLHRSYWAIDPNYDSADYTWPNYSVHEYPAQYRPTYDKTVKSWTKESIYDATGEAPAENAWALNYVNYNEANSKEDNVYTLENTFAYTEALKNYAPLRYGTHMLLTAQLLIADVDDVQFSDKNAETGFIDGVKTKLYADGYYWSEAAYLNWAFKHLSEYVANGVAHTSVKDVFSTTGAVKSYSKAHDDALNTLYVKDDTDYKPIVYRATAGGVLVNSAFELKKAYLENGDGKVALTLKDGVELYYCAEGETHDDGTVEQVYKPLSKEDVVCLVQTIMPAAAKYYNKGRMYYAIPVKHYSIYKEEFSGLGAAHYDDAGDMVDAEYELGDFGTVRNHWYRFNITKITKPGTPVDDPNDPIIPNEPEEYDYLGVEIVVLPWHVIDQNVEL